jgi:magnesium-protoporphyrin IX monomethyl ester (oxidative) cyclase
MSDVVLAYPPYGVVFGGGYSPLGLPYIASVLEGEGYVVRVVDADMEELGVEGLASVVRRERPFVLGVSVLTHTLPFVKRLIERVRECCPGCRVVVGGPHVTADPSIVSDLKADYGLRGEAEFSFPGLLGCLRDESEPEGRVDGLIYVDGGVLKADEPFFLDGLEGLPRPARHLIRTSEYRHTVVFGSRGCPYGCVYCAEQCRRVRYRSPDDVVDELSNLARDYCVRHVDFGDSVFTLNAQRVFDICGLLEERKIGLIWSCITRADLVNLDMLKSMRRSGCRFVSFGVESGVEDIRYAGGKRIPDDVLRNAFRMCRKAGLKTRASILFGNPGETVGDMKKSIEFARELKPDYALFSFTQLFPGTQLFESLLREGRVDANLWRDYMQGMRSTLDYLPDGVTQRDMDSVRMEAFRRFYLDWGYISRKIASVSSLEELKEAAFIVLAKAGVVPVGEGVADESDARIINMQY